MRRLYITGYTHNGIRQYAVNEVKKKAKAFEDSKKRQTGTSKVFTTHIDCTDRNQVEHQKQFYQEVNAMLSIKAGEPNVKGEFIDGSTDEAVEN